MCIRDSRCTVSFIVTFNTYMTRTHQTEVNMNEGRLKHSIAPLCVSLTDPLCPDCLIESIQITYLLSHRWSQKQRACHSAYCSAAYTLAALSNVQVWEAPSITNALPTPLSVLKPSVNTLDLFLQDRSTKEFQFSMVAQFLATSSRQFVLECIQ